MNTFMQVFLLLFYFNIYFQFIIRRLSLSKILLDYLTIIQK